MKIEKLDLEKALQSGWTEWRKYGKNRLYFDVKESELLDLGFYKSGNINFSEFKGEKISHADAGKLIGSNVYIDLDTMKLHVETIADEDMIDEIVKSTVAEIEVKEVKEEEETEDMENVLNVEVEETVEGIVGNTLSMELEETDAENIDKLSALISDAVMTQDKYDKLTDVWNEHSKLADLLEDLKQKNLIENYELLKGED